MSLKWTKCKEHVLPQTPRLVAFGHAYILLEVPKQLKNIFIIIPHHPQKLMLQYSIKG
jgi:hypothetical protein